MTWDVSETVWAPDHPVSVVEGGDYKNQGDDDDVRSEGVGHGVGDRHVDTRICSRKLRGLKVSSVWEEVAENWYSAKIGEYLNTAILKK